MRRLLALGLLAGAVSVAAPAQAAPICTPTSRAGVCVNLVTCTDLCLIDPWVDVYCNQGHPALALCAVIDRL
jgi:hypothetical protein